MVKKIFRLRDFGSYTITLLEFSEIFIKEECKSLVNFSSL